MDRGEFIDGYLTRLRAVRSEADIGTLYDWFWSIRDDIGSVAVAINRELNLIGEFELKSDLPCIAIGSLRGIVLVSANPGWIGRCNSYEDAFCRSSPDTYKKLMFDYFLEHPRVVGERVRWWSQPIGLLSMLRDSASRVGVIGSGAARWRRAHESRLLGGWELFPFHSISDGLTEHAGTPWLRECFAESLLAILRIAPETLIVASKTGFHLIRDLTAELKWKQSLLIDTQVSFAKTRGTELVAVSRQMFSAPRKFKNSELLETLNAFRSQ